MVGQHVRGCQTFTEWWMVATLIRVLRTQGTPPVIRWAVTTRPSVAPCLGVRSHSCVSSRTGSSQSCSRSSTWPSTARSGRSLTSALWDSAHSASWQPADHDVVEVREAPSPCVGQAGDHRAAVLWIDAVGPLQQSSAFKAVQQQRDASVERPVTCPMALGRAGPAMATTTRVSAPVSPRRAGDVGDCAGPVSAESRATKARPSGSTTPEGHLALWCPPPVIPPQPTPPPLRHVLASVVTSSRDAGGLHG